MTSAARQARRILNSGSPTVEKRQMARNRVRVAAAGDARRQCDAAYDWFRLAASRMTPAAYESALNRAARILQDLAIEAEADRDRSRGARDRKKANRG